ncbi:MAG: HEPN domain-containing protein [Thermoleophilia bacterium]|nr:HEPN domain-containing protein [Thermoleophilia bacterium]
MRSSRSTCTTRPASPSGARFARSSWRKSIATRSSSPGSRDARRGGRLPGSLALSPRSEELLAGARDRLGTTRAALAAAGFPSNAATAASHAMLYAVRAALSEEEQNAKTHSGTWGLFQETFVATERFDPELFAAAQRTRDLLEASDYEAVMVPHADAERIIEVAGRFVSAVVELTAR